MSAWQCIEHGLAAPTACCAKARRVSHVAHASTAPTTEITTTHSGHSFTKNSRRLAHNEIAAICRFELASGWDWRIYQFASSLAAEVTQEQVRALWREYLKNPPTEDEARRSWRDTVLRP